MERAEVAFDGLPASVPAARRFVAETLEAGGAADDGWVATQIVSELATNAVVHAGTTFVVRVEIEAAFVRIEVTDERPFATASARRFSDDTTTGRGLHLVDMLSEEWGVETTENTKTVWCQIVRVVAEAEPDISDYEASHLSNGDDDVASETTAPFEQEKQATVESWVA